MCSNLCLALLNFTEVQPHLSSLSRSLWMPSLPSSVWLHSQLGVLGKQSWGCLIPTAHVTKIMSVSAPIPTPRNATHHWFPLGHRAIDHDSWNANPSNSLWSTCPIPVSPMQRQACHAAQCQMHCTGPGAWVLQLTLFRPVPLQMFVNLFFQLSGCQKKLFPKTYEG